MIRREEAIRLLSGLMFKGESKEALDMAIKALEQEPCEMTAEEYRQRMMQAFHNADCGELIAVCVLPTEKEFEHLEWLLKNHYKKEPCEDAISRQAAHNMIRSLSRWCVRSEDGKWNNVGLLYDDVQFGLDKLPPVIPQSCGDCISRQAAQAELKNCEVVDVHDENDNHIGYYNADTVDSIVRNLPPVIPQPKMGRWITWKEAGSAIPSETRFECSVCHDAAQTLCNGLDLLSTYCPNCGAKMQEVEE